MVSVVILEKAQRQPRKIPRLSPEAKQSIIDSTEKNIETLETAQKIMASAIKEAQEQIKNAIREEKEKNTQEEEEDKKTDSVKVLGSYIDLDVKASEIKDEAEEYVVNSLPRRARELIKPMMFSTEWVSETGQFGDKYSYRKEIKTGSLIQTVKEAIKQEKQDLARYKTAEESEAEEIEEQVEELDKDKPREENLNAFINEEIAGIDPETGKPIPKQFKFDYVKLLEALKSALIVDDLKNLLEAGGTITNEQLEEVQMVSQELEESVALTTNILSRMGVRDVDGIRNLTKALISVSRTMKKDKREGVDFIESQISALQERLQGFEEPEGHKITPKTLKMLKQIKSMLENLDKTKGEDLEILEVLGKGNIAKNNFSFLKKVKANAESAFYNHVPSGKNFFMPLIEQPTKNKGNRYFEPKRSGKRMEAYRELEKLGRDIHSLLNKEDEGKALIELLRDVYRSMTGQILDIGAEKDLKRKFKDERRRRMALIRDSQEDTSEEFDEEEIADVRERRKEIKEREEEYMKERAQKIAERKAKEEAERKAKEEDE
jgi:hypothetical protein